MDHWDLDLEQTLADSESLLQSTSRDMDEDAEYSLDRILAEFGGGDAVPAETKAEPTVPEPTVPEPTAPAAEAPQTQEKEHRANILTFPGMKAAETPQVQDSPAQEASPAPAETPAPVSLQDVLEKTVQTVLAEQEKEPVIQEKPRRGLFRRDKQKETEELYARVAKEETAESVPDEPPEEADEPTFLDAVAAARSSMRAQRGGMLCVGVIAALMVLAQLAEFFSLLPESFLADPMLHVLPFAALELIACIFARRVFVRALREIAAFRFSYCVPTALSCLATLCDTALYYFRPERAGGASPLGAVAVIALFCALLGEFSIERARLSTFRIAGIGTQPYIVTVTSGGAAKRNGSVQGFYNCTMREDCSAHAQRSLLPVIVVAAFVFSVLAALEQRSAEGFLWDLSALLCAAGGFALPLCYALPYRRLAVRLAKSGCALAGFEGARAIRSSNCVILTDGDLFPPGTISLNGLKVFGEESGKVISYAATMARAAHSGLSPLFDNLMASDGGHIEKIDSLSFYEEGGISGTIRGESVLFGTQLFFRKRGVTLPRDIRLQTGVYLAVDGTLIAVFAVKYMAAENVDWAMHALSRNRITPVLAVRDGNITTSLLKRKFKTNARAVIPKLSTRLALSERTGGRPFALLQREGLMPYAEVALGSKKLYRSVRVGSFLSLFGSIAGLLLVFYLTFSSAFDALSCVSMLLFSALWAFASLLDGLFVARY